MRAKLDDVVRQHLDQGKAIPALTAYSFSTAAAAVAAAEHRGRAVVLLVAPNTAGDPDGMRLIQALRGLADTSSVPVCVQLDHAKNESLITAAIGAGVDSVLADGSNRSFEDNVAFVQQVIARAAGTGVVVESELGAIDGDEDRATRSGARQVVGLVDADMAADFVQRSGAHLLAPAVGNAHGKYVGEPRLHWDLIDALRKSVPVPLVMHGASGIPVAGLRRAIRAGFGKVNINTELRAAILSELERTSPIARVDGLDLLSVERAQRQAVFAFTTAAFDTLDSGIK